MLKRSSLLLLGDKMASRDGTNGRWLGLHDVIKAESCQSPMKSVSQYKDTACAFVLRSKLLPADTEPAASRPVIRELLDKPPSPWQFVIVPHVTNVAPTRVAKTPSNNKSDTGEEQPCTQVGSAHHVTQKLNSFFHNQYYITSFSLFSFT